MITHDIRTLLLAQSSITTLAPSQTVNRVSLPSIVCDSAPQGMRPPYIVITDISKNTMVCLDGTYGMAGTEVDIDCYGYDEPTMRTLADTVRAFFDDYTGAAGNSTINAVVWQNENYSYESPSDGRDARFHIQTNTYLVQHS